MKVEVVDGGGKVIATKEVSCNLPVEALELIKKKGLIDFDYRVAENGRVYVTRIGNRNFTAAQRTLARDILVGEIRQKAKDGRNLQKSEN